MSVGLNVQLNGTPRNFPELTAPAELATLISVLELKGDRIAVELNGEIAPRTKWAELLVRDGDKLEIVHFVGGGSGNLSGLHKAERLHHSS
jgi:sulfur carrier protein